MTRTHINNFKTVFYTIIAILLLSFNSFARICANGSGFGYGEDGTGGENFSFESVCSATIERQVEIAGGYFLNASSNLLKFSSLIEMSNINGSNYEQCLIEVEEALNNINQAKANYNSLMKMAESTSYNYRFVYKLWYFDYYGFQRKYSLNASIFDEVEKFLAVGDINGFFQKIYNNIIEIEGLLMNIRNNILRQTMPVLENVWEINEKTVELLLFSQYASRVFYAI